MANPGAITPFTFPAYSGPFVHDTKQLRTVLRAHLPSYYEYDPRTWPLISTATISSSTGEEYDGLKPLPWKVAYTTDVAKRYVENYGASRKRTTSVRKGVAMHLLHRYFPCNFNEYGVLKGEPGMSVREYEAWVRDVTLTGSGEGGAKRRRVDAARTRSCTVTPKSSVACEASGERSESSPSSSGLEFGISPDEAFREIKDIMAGKLGAGGDADLRAEMLHMRVELAQETKRADAAEARVRELERKLEEKDREAGRVKKEADHANERILEIWAGMRYAEA